MKPGFTHTYKMEEEDINFLLKKGYWLSVVPIGKKWRCIIYTKEKKGWEPKNSRLHTTPVKAYDWARDMFDKIIDEDGV